MTVTKETRERVYQFILRSGAAGLTDEEISEGLDAPGDTLRPRRNELVKTNKVINSGYRRLTSRGRKAIVWKAVSAKIKPKVVQVHSPAGAKTVAKIVANAKAKTR